MSVTKLANVASFFVECFLDGDRKRPKQVRGFLCDCILLCQLLCSCRNKLHGTWIILKQNISSFSSKRATLLYLKVPGLVCPLWRRKWVWNIGRMILTRDSRSTRKETCASATLSTTHLRWIGPGLKPGLSAVTGLWLTTRAKARRYIPEVHQSSV